MFFKKNEGEIRTTSNIEDLNVFIISRAAPLEMLKKCPSWKKKMIPDRNMDSRKTPRMVTTQGNTWVSVLFKPLFKIIDYLNRNNNNVYCVIYNINKLKVWQ